MKEYTVCFTGHRKMPLEKRDILALRLKAILVKLINDGYIYFQAGGALGFDTLAAQIVLDLKSNYPQINLILVLPCLSQTRGWSDSDKEIYEDIKKNADEVIYTSQEYARGCMHKRNRYLVDNSSVCVCYLTKNTGGTAYTVDYAHKNKIAIINLGDRT